MKGLRLWNVKYFTLSLVALLVCFFCSFIINQNNASAVSDLVYTFDFSNIPSWYDICQDSPDCSSYSYLLVESTASCNSTCNFFVSGIAPGNTAVSAASSSLYFLSSPSHIWLTGGGTNKTSGSITLTLSDHFGSSPSGSITLTENGTFNVTDYATAVVDVPPEVVQGDYHDDLVNLKYAVIFVPAVALVIYFFYAIYKMLLGGKTL